MEKYTIQDKEFTLNEPTVQRRHDLANWNLKFNKHLREHTGLTIYTSDVLKDNFAEISSAFTTFLFEKNKHNLEELLLITIKEDIKELKLTPDTDAEYDELSLKAFQVYIDFLLYWKKG